jgi:FkbM family methyltransferase
LASGITIEVASPADWEAYNEIFVSAEYDKAILSALNRAVGHDVGITVLDIGANLGYFSLRVLDLVRTRIPAPPTPDLTMVEGSPRVLADLRRRAAFRELTKSNARIIHGLAGQKTGSAMLYESDLHLFNSIMDRRGTATEVGFVDLEQTLSNHARVDLMKCDIQGAEEQFLENAPSLLKKTSVAVLELHHLLCDTARCLAMLRAAGFSRIETLRENSSISVVHCER